MFKIGDKFIIVVDSVMTNHKGVLYGIKGFKSLVFDNYGLEQLEKANKPCSESVEVWKEKYKKALMDNNELTRENSELKKRILEISILLGNTKDALKFD